MGNFGKALMAFGDGLQGKSQPQGPSIQDIIALKKFERSQQPVTIPALTDTRPTMPHEIEGIINTGLERTGLPTKPPGFARFGSGELQPGQARLPGGVGKTEKTILPERQVDRSFAGNMMKQRQDLQAKQNDPKVMLDRLKLRAAQDPEFAASLSDEAKSVLGITGGGGEDGGFSLSQGQTRFDAQGNPIANVPLGPGKGTGPTKTKAEGVILKKFLSKQDLSTEEKFVFRKMFDSDPALSAAIRLESQDLDSLGRAPEERAAIIEDLANKIRSGTTRELDELLGGQDAQTGGPPEGLPDPAEHTGKTIRDTETGKRYRSNGEEWVEIQ